MPRARQVVAKGAFGPSFANLEDTNQPQSKGDIEEEQEKKKGKGKHKLTISKLLTKYTICRLDRHLLSNCLYVFLEKAKGKFWA